MDRGYAKFERVRSSEFDISAIKLQIFTTINNVPSQYTIAEIHLSGRAYCFWNEVNKFTLTSKKLKNVFF